MIDNKVLTFDILSEKLTMLKEDGYDLINVDALIDFVEKVKQAATNISVEKTIK